MESIAALHTKLTSHLLALGIVPSGAVVGDLVQDFLPHVAGQLTGARRLGVPSDLDWEGLRELRPAAIYWAGLNDGDTLRSLEEIAPVRRIDVQAGDWRQQLRVVASSVGREAAAEAFIAAYADKAARVGALLARKFAPGTRFAALRAVGGELRLMGVKRPLGHILYEDLGLKPAAAVERIERPYETLEPAELHRIADADVLLLMVFDSDESRAFYDRLRLSPAWNSLQAVQKGRSISCKGRPGSIIRPPGIWPPSTMPRHSHNSWQTRPLRRVFSL